MPLPVSLAPKAPGQLIRSDDWNALVAGVNAIESTLQTAINTVGTRVDVLDATVATLSTAVFNAQADIATLRTDVDALLANSYRVTLEATKLNYAIGELAELTATLRDLNGDVPAPVGGERPWVDFVTTWGQLRPMAGFVTRVGVGDRSVAVQTNAQGVARVRLMADIVEDLTEDTEQEFSSFLTTVVDGQARTFADVMLTANTPSDQPVLQAYRVAQRSYDNPGGGAVRNYIDSYYYANSAKLSGKVVPGFTNQRRERWRDHHITVLAFGKADSDPRTPDHTRGSNSIQLTFRDWIGPWIIVDYLPNFTAEIPNLLNRIQPAITLNFTETADILTDIAQQQVAGKGLLGKTRQYEAFINAIDQVSPTQPVAFLPQLKNSMRSAFTLQQAFQQTQVATPGGGDTETALQAFSQTAVKASSQVSGVDTQVQQVRQQVTQASATFEQQVQSLSRSVSAIGGRIDATLAEGGQLQQIRSNLNAVSDQVQALRSLGDPIRVNERINLITSLDNRLQRLELGT